MTYLLKSVDLSGGLRLPYVEQGDPTGIPVILLHGLTDSWRSFELVLAHLPPSIRAFALTQRGHAGAAQPENGYRPSDFAKDLVAFMDAVGVEAAFVAGHSSHTFVAERFAIDHPHSAPGLILIGAPRRLGDKPGVKGLLESVGGLSDPIEPAFVRDFVAGTFGRPLPPAFLDAMVEEALKVPARVWRASFVGLIEEDVPKELDKIITPSLMIWGEEDAIVPRSDQDELLGTIKGSRLIVYSGTGHSPHWEEPERFASDLAAFVEAVAT